MPPSSEPDPLHPIDWESFYANHRKPGFFLWRNHLERKADLFLHQLNEIPTIICRATGLRRNAAQALHNQ